MRLSGKHRAGIFFVFLAFCVVLLSLITGMAIKNYNDSQNILKESISSRMISMAMTAREIIDPQNFLEYNSLSDMEKDSGYGETLEKLRTTANHIGAKYLYALKEIDGKYYFLYDTDLKEDTRFTEYNPGEVYLKAFQGENSASPYNANDEFGSFSSGAVPVIVDNKVVGIVGADVDDQLVEQHRDAQFRNMAFLIALIFLTLLFMAVLLAILLKKIKDAQDKLYRQAHYDKLTDLPNRQYLLEHLGKATADKKKMPFSLFFIDLDNFKKVNDTAGHDAGDALLQNIGNFLSSAHVNTKVFRPSAGALNVAARIGGDEFILVAPGLTAEESESFAKELIEGLQTKVSDKNIKKFHVGLSIGIVMFPEHSENFHVLIKYADIAMYHAKRAGKNAFLSYNDEMKEKDEK